jgi:hypothetical protein
MSLVSFSFPYLTSATEEMDANIVIKKLAGVEHRSIRLICRPTKGVRTDERPALSISE